MLNKILYSILDFQAIVKFQTGSCIYLDKKAAISA